MLVVFRDSHAAIQRTAHVEPGVRHWYAGGDNGTSLALLAPGLKTEIHCVPEHSGILGYKETDHQANIAPEACGDMVRNQPYTRAANMA